jgi:hypothetical protein
MHKESAKKQQINDATLQRSIEEVEQIVIMEQLHRYNCGMACGTAVLHRHLRDQCCVHPLPSVSRITQILTRYGLTHGRTGWYKGDEPSWLPSSARIPVTKRR